MKTSIIKHCEGMPLVMLRGDYLAICKDADGKSSIPAAVILSILEYWTNIKLAAKKAHGQNKALRKEDITETARDAWIWKSHCEFIADSIGLLKRHDVKSALPLLQALGFISIRRNPKYRWDRRLQYLLNNDAVNQALKDFEGRQSVDIGHAPQVDDGSTTGDELNEWQAQMHAPQLTDQCGAGARAISETPLEYVQDTTTTDVVVFLRKIKSFRSSPFAEVSNAQYQSLVEKHGVSTVFETVDILLDSYAGKYDRVKDAFILLRSMLIEGVTPNPGYVPFSARKAAAQKDAAFEANAESRREYIYNAERVKRTVTNN